MVSLSFRSAKGAVACRQTREKLAISLGGALDTAPVLRLFLKSALSRTCALPVAAVESMQERIK